MNLRTIWAALLCCLIFDLLPKTHAQDPNMPPPPSTPAPDDKTTPMPRPPDPGGNAGQQGPMPPADTNPPLPGNPFGGQSGAGSHPGPMPPAMAPAPPGAAPKGPPVASKAQAAGIPKRDKDAPGEPPQQAAVLAEDSYENGALIVRQKAEKPFSIHSGDSINYRMEIEVTSGVILDLTAIKQGVLGNLQGSDFRHFDDRNPDIKITSFTKGEKTIWVVDMRLQTFQFLPAGAVAKTFQRKLLLILAFQYATEKIGGYPAWKRLETRPYEIWWVPSTDDKPNIIEGNLSPAPLQQSNWRPALTVAAVFLIAFPLAFWVLSLLAQRAQRRAPNSQATAWARIGAIYERAHEGINQALGSELRVVLATMLGSLSDTDEELLLKVDGGPRREALQVVLHALDRLRRKTQPTTLNPTDSAALLDHLRRIVGVN